MKTLESFDFGTKAARAATYNWDEIMDGEIHVLEAGKDFTCKRSTLVVMARRVAEKMGMGLRVGNKDGNAVFQAYELSKEEKAFVLAKSGKKEAAAAAKKAAKAGTTTKAPVVDDEELEDEMEDEELEDEMEDEDEDEDEEEEEVVKPAPKGKGGRKGK